MSEWKTCVHDLGLCGQVKTSLCVVGLCGCLN